MVQAEVCVLILEILRLDEIVAVGADEPVHTVADVLHEIQVRPVKQLRLSFGRGLWERSFVRQGKFVTASFPELRRRSPAIPCPSGCVALGGSTRQSLRGPVPPQYHHVARFQKLATPFAKARDEWPPTSSLVARRVVSTGARVLVVLRPFRVQARRMF